MLPSAFKPELEKRAKPAFTCRSKRSCAAPLDCSHGNKCQVSAECDCVTQRNTSSGVPMAIIILCKCLVAIVLSGRCLTGSVSSVRVQKARRKNSAQNEKTIGRFPKFISGGRRESTVTESRMASNAKHNLFKWLQQLCWFWEEPSGGKPQHVQRF